MNHENEPVYGTPENPIISSNYTAEKAIALNPDVPWENLAKEFEAKANGQGLEFSLRDFAEKVKARQEIITIGYRNFQGEYCQGQLIVDKRLVREAKKMLAILYEADFPIATIKPAVAYDFDDDKSMADNASTSFMFRTIAHKPKLSLHSIGVAVDINPKQNPMIIGNQSFPLESNYDEKQPGTITPELAGIIKKETLYKDWGGEWENGVLDYQHFQVPVDLLIEQSPNEEDKSYWQYIKRLQRLELMGL